MSLEIALAENTAAIRELIAALANGKHATPAQVEAVVTEAKTEKAAAKKSTPAKTEEPATTQPTAEAVADAAPEKKAESSEQAQESSAPTYQDAAAAITKLSRTKGRDAAVELLGKYGASKLPDVKAEQFADIIREATEATEA